MMAGLPHSASPARSSALLTADILIGHPPRRHQRFSSYIPYFCSLRMTCTDAARQNDHRRKPMTTTTMRIARAEPTDEHLKAVLGLIEGAATWLRYKDTDQWASPWPDEKRRDERVLKGLQVGKTWIIWDGDIAAATITTATRANSSVWSKPACTSDLSERAVYAHRLITARNYSGCGLGAELIDWAGLRARREYGARWIRIDVWTSNKALHDYYRKRGFMSCGSCADPAYPSGVLFQKPSAGLRTRRIPQFSGSAADFDMAGLRAPVLSG
jgi:GNAT superfamily N-acetyltransferase